MGMLVRARKSGGMSRLAASVVTICTSANCASSSAMSGTLMAATLPLTPSSTWGRLRRYKAFPRLTREVVCSLH